MEFSS